MYIYKTVCLLNSKIYIGQTIRSWERSKSYFGSGFYIMNVIKKYGKENFVKILLMECKTQEELDKWERFFILSNKSHKREFGYNCIPGAASCKNVTLSAEHVKKISIANTGKYHTEETKRKLSDLMSGRKQTAEHIQKRINAKIKNGTTTKGKILSEETKAKIRTARVLQTNIPMKGKSHTEETKKRLSDAAKLNYQNRLKAA